MRALLPISDSPERKVEARRELLLRQIQPLDCFAEPVGAHSCDSLTGNDGKRALLRHCLRQTRSVCARERSDEAIQSFFAQRDGLLRCARNDGEAWIALSRSLSWARIRATRWLAMTGSARSSVIACDKREAFAQGSEATKQSIFLFVEGWIASLRSQ